MGSGLYAEEEAGKFMLGKYLSDKQIPLRQRRRLGMVVAGITPTASRLNKIGKMQSAGCRLCRIARDIMAGGTYMTACMLHKSQKAGSSLSLLTKKSNMSTLWRREEFLRICSEEDLAEKAKAIEVTIPVKKSQKTWYKHNPVSFFVNRFLGNVQEGKKDKHMYKKEKKTNLSLIM